MFYIICRCFIFLVLIYFAWLIKKQALNAKFSLIWLFVAAVLEVLLFIPNATFAIASRLGFNNSVQFILAIFVVLLIAVTIHLSIHISRSEQKIRVLAEELAIIKQKVNSTSPQSTKITKVKVRKNSAKNLK